METKPKKRAENWKSSASIYLRKKTNSFSETNKARLGLNPQTLKCKRTDVPLDQVRKSPAFNDQK